VRRAYGDFPSCLKYNAVKTMSNSTPQWKIILPDGLHKKGQALLSQVAQVHECQGISIQDLFEIIANYDALIVRSHTRVNSTIIENAHRLKVIGRAGAGVDNIDLSAAAAHQITVVNAPLSTTLAVAELTLALMLALARNIPRADATMKSAQWIKGELEGIEISGKVLGIIGVGNIGTEVAHRTTALGMTVLGYDQLAAETIRERGVQPVSLADLYARSDFISLHVPLNPQTRNYIDGQALGHMKRGVRLICTARGGILDETALLGALESGQVAGAALDVYAQEPPGMSALVSHPNVIATPHIAAQTQEAQERAGIDIASEVLHALRGERLHWKVV
jgi:D-3-phosphoglycerate dehydrogenase